MKKTSHRIIFWISILSAVLISIFTIIFLTTATLNGKVSLGTVSESDQVKGNKNSDIILIEYSDYQCPACVFYYYLTEEVFAEFENHIQYVYRHFPLRRIHPHAQMSAQASEAAGKQGKFWEMYDMIFVNQNKWADKSQKEATNIFAEYAQELDLDIKQFMEDLESLEIVEKVNADYDSAIEEGLYYTPTFILNGEIINNPQNPEEFRSLIKKEIEKNNT